MTSVNNNSINNSFSSKPVSYNTVLAQLAYVGVPSDPSLYQTWVNAMLSAVPNTVDPTQVSQVFQVQAANGTITNVTITAAQLGINGTVAAADKQKIWENFLSSFSSSNPMPTTLPAFNNAWLAFVRTAVSQTLYSTMANQIITNQQTAQLLQNQIEATKAQIDTINAAQATSNVTTTTGVLTLQQQKTNAMAAIQADLLLLPSTLNQALGDITVAELQSYLNSWNYQGDAPDIYFLLNLVEQATAAPTASKPFPTANVFNDIYNNINTVSMLNQMMAEVPPVAMGSQAQKDIYTVILLSQYTQAGDNGFNNNVQHVIDVFNNFFSDHGDKESVLNSFIIARLGTGYARTLFATIGEVYSDQNIGYKYELQNMLVPVGTDGNGYPYAPSGQLSNIKSLLSTYSSGNLSLLLGTFQSSLAAIQPYLNTQSYNQNLTQSEYQQATTDVNSINTALNHLITHPNNVDDIAIIKNLLNDLAGYVSPSVLGTVQAAFNAYRASSLATVAVSAAIADINTLSGYFYNFSQGQPPLPSKFAIVSLVTDLQAQLAALKGQIQTLPFLDNLITSVQPTLLDINAQIYTSIGSFDFGNAAATQLSTAVGDIIDDNDVEHFPNIGQGQDKVSDLIQAYQAALNANVYPISASVQNNIDNAKDLLLSFFESHDFSNYPADLAILQPLLQALQTYYETTIQFLVNKSNVLSSGGIYQALSQSQFSLTPAGAAYVAAAGVSNPGTQYVSYLSTLMQTGIAKLGTNAANVIFPSFPNDVAYNDVITSIQQTVQSLIAQVNKQVSGLGGYAVQLNTIKSDVQQQIGMLQATLDQANALFASHNTDQNLILLKALIPQAMALLPALVSQVQPISGLGGNSTQESGTSTTIGSGTYASQLVLVQQLLSNITATSVLANTTYGTGVAKLGSSFTSLGTGIISSLSNISSEFNSSTVANTVNTLNSLITESQPYLSYIPQMRTYLEAQLALYKQLESQFQVVASAMVNVSSGIGSTGLTAGAASLAINTIFNTLFTNSKSLSQTSSNVIFNDFLAVLGKNMPLSFSTTNIVLGQSLANTPSLTSLLAIRSQLAGLDPSASIPAALYNAIAAFQTQLSNAFTAVQNNSTSSALISASTQTAIQGALNQFNALTSTGNASFGLFSTLRTQWNAFKASVSVTPAQQADWDAIDNAFMNLPNLIDARSGAPNTPITAAHLNLFNNYMTSLSNAISHLTTITVDAAPVVALSALQTTMVQFSAGINTILSAQFLVTNSINGSFTDVNNANIANATAIQTQINALALPAAVVAATTAFNDIRPVLQSISANPAIVLPASVMATLQINITNFNAAIASLASLNYGGITSGGNLASIIQPNMVSLVNQLNTWIASNSSGLQTISGSLISSVNTQVGDLTTAPQASLTVLKGVVNSNITSILGNLGTALSHLDSPSDYTSNLAAIQSALSSFNATFVSGGTASISAIQGNLAALNSGINVLIQAPAIVVQQPFNSPTVGGFPGLGNLIQTNLNALTLPAAFTTTLATFTPINNAVLAFKNGTMSQFAFMAQQATLTTQYNNFKAQLAQLVTAGYPGASAIQALLTPNFEYEFNLLFQNIGDPSGLLNTVSSVTTQVVTGLNGLLSPQINIDAAKNAYADLKAITDTIFNTIPLTLDQTRDIQGKIASFNTALAALSTVSVSAHLNLNLAPIQDLTSFLSLAVGKLIASGVTVADPSANQGATIQTQLNALTFPSLDLTNANSALVPILQLLNAFPPAPALTAAQKTALVGNLATLTAATASLSNPSAARTNVTNLVSQINTWIADSSPANTGNVNVALGGIVSSQLNSLVSANAAIAAINQVLSSSTTLSSGQALAVLANVTSLSAAITNMASILPAGSLDQIQAGIATLISKVNSMTLGQTVGNTLFNLGSNAQTLWNLYKSSNAPSSAITAASANLNAINKTLSNIGATTLLTNSQIDTLLANISSFNTALQTFNSQSPGSVPNDLPFLMSELGVRLNRMLSSSTIANQEDVLNEQLDLYNQQLAAIPGLNLFPLITSTLNVGATITALPLNVTTIATAAFIIDPVAALSASVNGVLNSANDIPGYTPPSTAVSNAQITTFFNNFAKNYNSSGAQSQTTFFNQLGQSLAVFAGVQTDTVLTFTGATPGTTQEDLLRFENVYYAIFPNATPSEFNTAFQTFYDKAVNANGLFVPSQEFSAWVSSLQVSSASFGGVFTDTTSLASIGADKVLILNNIYALIGTMLKAMQKITALQADRLNILTSWQQAYTEALGQMPTFLVSGPASWIGSLASDINTNFNQIARSTMTTNQGIISDEAKAMQSTINQSNSAVSTQSNMAQTIITQLTTILGSIFK